MNTKKMVVGLGVLLGVIIVLGVRQDAFCREGPPPEARMKLGEAAPADRPGPERIEQIKQRIENLRARAQEAEQQARRLRAEVSELERALRSEPARADRPREVPQPVQRIAELERQLDRAEREGRPEEAQMLREKIRAARLVRPQPEAQQPGRIRVAVKEPPQPDVEQPRRLRVAVKEPEQRQPMPVRDEPPVPEQIERMRRELGEVKEAAMRAANEGRERDAAELQQRARELGMGIEKATAEFKKRDIAQKVRQLRWMAAQAKQAGDNERAEKMVREADDLQRRLQNAPEPRKQPTPEKRQQRPSPERQQQDEVRRAIMELRGEVVRLRDQVEQLKREVRR